MADQTAQIKRAYDLIKANQKKDASKILISVLKTDRNNARAWLLLAHASSKKENAIQALQQVLRIQPDNENARQMLTKLGGASPSTSTPTPPAAPPAPPAADRFSMGGSTDVGDRWSTAQSGFSSGAAPSDAFSVSGSNDPFAGSSFGAPSVDDDDPFADYNPNPDPFGATGGDPFDDDPFAAPASSASIADDPFAAPPRDSSPTYEASSDYDPFGSSLPSDKPPASRPAPADPFSDDPFADDPFSSPAPAYDPFSDVSARTGDPFGDDPFSPSNDPFTDDPFAAAGSGTRARNTPQTAKSGSSGNTVLIVVLVVVVVVVLGCGVGAFLLTRSLTEVTTAMLESEEFSDIMEEMSATLEAGGGGSVSGGSDGMPANLIMRGNVNVNQTVRGTLTQGRDDGWTVQGTAGQTIVIEMTAITADFDTRVYLYDSAGNWVGENDDITAGGNTDSRLTITLPRTDAYTIRASEFYGFAGDYQLAVRPG